MKPTDYLNDTIRRTRKKIQLLEEELMDSKVFRKWRKRFGNKSKLGSKPQLEKVIFEDMGYERTGRKTDKGQHKTDESAFEFVDDPFVKDYFRKEKLAKSEDYLNQIAREICDGYIHPFSNLHTTISYRSSMDRPSFQNFPIRDPLQAELIRSTVIAPLGYRVGEIDISGNEVRWSVVYHNDPKMREYLLDPKTDMHRDMAMQCYLLPRKDVEENKYDPKKMKRYVAKNRFVFPQFYGSWWWKCSRSLWEAIDLYDLKTIDGTNLKKHLKRKGIRDLGDCSEKEQPNEGTFQHHIQKVEKDFWGRRFLVYADWKKEWWEQFCRTGWFPYKTGFVGSGALNRKQVCNYPIQGSAFHGLLWCLCELQDWLNKKGMKTKIIAQIHDSIIMYLWHSEIDEVLSKAKQIMTKRMLKHWSFINIPFEVDAEVSPKGASWYLKKKRKIQ
jgi:DNA polymerase-1